MNALRATMQRPVATVGRRFASATVKNPLVPEIYFKRTFKANFLSDPATYPIMVVMAVATTFLTGMSLNALFNYKGLRINPAHKHETINTWDINNGSHVTQTLTRNPIAFHAQAFKDIRYEGLGVDHEEWKKSKGL